MKVIIGLLCVGGILSMSRPLRAEMDSTGPGMGQDSTAAASATMAAPLKVEMKLGTGIESLEVTGPADSFDESVEKVVGWSLVEGAAEPTEISHVWIYKGNEISAVVLPVKSAHYRTYTRKTVTGMPGTWTFQVKDTGGNVLGEKKFEVTPSAMVPAKADPANAVPANAVPATEAPATKTQ